MFIPVNVVIYLFIVVVVVGMLIYLQSKPSRGSYINLDGCASLFVVFLLIMYTLIWGGIYWW